MKKTTYLTKLEIEGLKGGNKTYLFDKGITVFIGSNGSGKTTVLQALHLLLRGKVPRSSGMSPASIGKDILRLSSTGRFLAISGEWTNPEGVGCFVKREWKMAGGKVTEKINQNINKNTTGTKEQQGLLNLHFGNVTEIWDPSQFFGLSAAKLRSKIMGSIASRKISDVIDLFPSDIPKNFAPGSLDMPAESWLQHAMKRVDESIRETQAEIRIHKRTLDAGIEFVKHRTEEEVKAHLKVLLDKLSNAKSLDRYTEKLAHLKGRLSVLEEQTGKVKTEIEIVLAERQSAFARGELAKKEDMAAIHEEHMAVLEELKIVGAQQELSQQLEDAEEGLEVCQNFERKEKILRDDLKKTEQKLLMSAREPFERTISEVVGKECKIDLRSGGCLIKVGGVDISGLSDGENLRFVPGIAAALAANAESNWIPLPIDRLEAVSSNERAGFLDAIGGLIDDGCISQAFLAGCPDNGEAGLKERGIKVYNLDKTI